MRFISLGSGSRGNATLIESESTRLMLDCGFAARETERRLEAVGVDVDTIDAILVSHEHQDHIRGVGTLARRYEIPVWMTFGTARQDRCGAVPHQHLFHAHQGSFSIGGIEITPFPVPHDAAEPAQFLFKSENKCFGVLSDAGSYTPHIVELLRSCDALFLECNYDQTLLREGPYPPMLQRRVGGRYGHLGNHQAQAFLQKIDFDRLHHLLLCHLSENNNRPELAWQALTQTAPTLKERITVATQDQATPWFEL